MNNKLSDIRSLGEDIQLSEQLKKYKLIIKRYFAPVVAFFIVVIVIIIGQWLQLKFYQNAYKLNYISVYNMEQTIVKKDRKKNAMLMISKVALKYNPKMNEITLANIAETIYDIGECKYDIPVEEWIILYTLESRWHIRAVSPAGAMGLGQLMPTTARMVAKILGIIWHGEPTLFNPVDNLKISMRYYFELKTTFKNPYYYIAAYAGGENAVGKFFKQKIKLSGDYKKYIKDLIIAKHQVEKILDKKIMISGIEGI